MNSSEEREANRSGAHRASHATVACSTCGVYQSVEVDYDDGQVQQSDPLCSQCGEFGRMIPCQNSQQRWFEGSACGAAMDGDEIDAAQSVPLIRVPHAALTAPDWAAPYLAAVRDALYALLRSYGWPV
jgi:hypothetical protein